MAREHSTYVERPEAIEHALALVDPAEPPTAAQFRGLSSTAPAPAFRSRPEPKQAQRAAEVRRKCLRPVMPRIGRDVRWAADMVRRARSRRARAQVQPAAGTGRLEPARLAAVAPRWEERIR